MTEMFGEAWSPMSVPDLAPDDDDDDDVFKELQRDAISDCSISKGEAESETERGREKCAVLCCRDSHGAKVS